MKRASVVLVIVAALVVGGCSSPPDQAEADARAALREAREAGAEIYAPAELENAQSAYDRAQAEKERQDQRFRLFRSYDLAKEIYIESRDLAVVAKGAAQRGKSDRVQLSQQLLSRALRAVEASADTLAGAPQGKGIKIDIAVYEQDIQDLNTEAQTVQPYIDSGQYDKADSLSQGISRRATALQEEIVTASRRRRP